MSSLKHACELLVEAYRLGKERGGSVDWSHVDQAYVEAVAALKLLTLETMAIGLKVISINRVGGSYPGSMYNIDPGAKGTITSVNPSPNDEEAGGHACEITLDEHCEDLDTWDNVLHVTIADGDANLDDFEICDG